MKGELSKNRVVTHADILRHFSLTSLKKGDASPRPKGNTGRSRPRQTLQRGLARWNYNKDGNIVFRHIFCRKCAIAKEAIREYNLKSPHYGTLI